MTTTSYCSLCRSPTREGGVRFNSIPEAANEDKDEEAYDNDEVTEDVEREDEFYGLLAAPCARSASRIGVEASKLRGASHGESATDRILRPSSHLD
ncbi:hypothetical protein MUK42_24043 [Musa troglodytarum]|uniref:Uncharacterized protein n=1 Tax=Musa troglodytarum TaxID=320322 RepID=A0A9E7JCA2_9LILI|nr:hypothetical protein MUK42_24043 [Musa troglodytarum]